MKQLFVGMLLFYSVIVAQDVTVVYMGIIPGGAPEYEEKFNGLIREQITVIPGIRLADYDDTQ